MGKLRHCHVLTGKKIVPILLLMLLFPCQSLAARAKADTITVRFRINESRIDTAFADNAEALRRLSEMLDEGVSDTLHVFASASPDGRTAANRELARRRGQALADFISERCLGIYCHVHASAAGWDAVLASAKADTGMDDRAEAEALLEKPHANPAGTQAALKQLGHGSSYRYIACRHLPDLRYARCVVPSSQAILPDSCVGIFPVQAFFPGMPEERACPPFGAQEKPARWRISTNLLYWAALAHNVGVEYDINDRQSLTLGGECAWWSKLSRQRVYRWMAAELAYHCYFRRHARHKGFFMGAYVQTGEFELMFSRKNRKGEFTGGGLCAGYRWLFRERLSLSAEVGVGYLYTDYRYALDMDGILIRQGRNYHHYVGPSRLALTLAFDLKKKAR